MEKKFCPSCHNELEVMSACGSVSYFCNACNELKSSKTVLNEEENTKAIKDKAAKE